MLFILIKTLSQFLYPLFSSLIGVCVGLIAARYRRRLGLTLTALSLAYLYLCSTQQFASWYAATLENDYERLNSAELDAADAVVVLGGGVFYSGGLMELRESSDRVLHGARLLKDGKAPFIIVSAGKAYGDVPNSVAMAEFLTDLNVPPEKIIQESQARNTYEHTVYLEPILEKQAIRSVILVTSSWHMRRSLAVFESNLPDIEVTPFPVDSMKGKTHTIIDFLPTYQGLSKTTKISKEYIGYMVYDIRGWIE